MASDVSAPAAPADSGSGSGLLIGGGIVAIGGLVLLLRAKSTGAPTPPATPGAPTPPPGTYHGEQCVGNGASTINVNQAICPGTGLRSPGGAVTFAMQDDGNLVVYEGGVAKWASNTNAYPGSYAVMQSDGNLVVYDVNGTARWASGTSGYSGATCRVQDDGNVVLYDASGNARWASNTAYSELNPPPAAGAPTPPPPSAAPTPPPPAQCLTNLAKVIANGGSANVRDVLRWATSDILNSPTYACGQQVYNNALQWESQWDQFAASNKAILDAALNYLQQEVSNLGSSSAANGYLQTLRNWGFTLTWSNGWQVNWA